MDLGNLKGSAGARKRNKRLGRGDGSGHGGTSTKGHKGQKARSGRMGASGFEGGQMPLVRRIPKRGFSNFSRQKAGIVNIGSLSELPKGTVVDEKFLKSEGLLRGRFSFIKVLGNGSLKSSLTIRAHRFSKSAEKKITEAGGKAEVVQ